MSTKTTNYNLVKPEVQDFIDIAVLNGNMDIIDALLKLLNDEKFAKTGGEMTGNVTVKSASYPKVAFIDTTAESQGAVEAASHGIALIAANEVGDYTNYRSLIVRDSDNAQGALNVALQLLNRVNGVTEYYNVYHAGNKPTAADVGAIGTSGNDTKNGNLTVEGIEYARSFAVLPAHYNTSVDFGQYIDMHVAGSTADYDGRISLNAAKELLYNGKKIYHEGNTPAVVADATLEE